MKKLNILCKVFFQIRVTPLRFYGNCLLDFAPTPVIFQFFNFSFSYFSFSHFSFRFFISYFFIFYLCFSHSWYPVLQLYGHWTQRRSGPHTLRVQPNGGKLHRGWHDQSVLNIHIVQKHHRFPLRLPETLHFGYSADLQVNDCHWFV